MKPENFTKNSPLVEHTGICSEIRIGTLVSGDNEYLTYPCRVVVHVMERGCYGGIGQVTVNTGKGAWVTCQRAQFSDLSKPLPYQYQKCNPAAILASDPYHNPQKLVGLLDQIVKYHENPEWRQEKEAKCAELTDGSVAFIDVLMNQAEQFSRDIKNQHQYH